MRMILRLLVMAFFFGCTVRDMPIVESRGSLHSMMMQNDVGPKVALDTLMRENLYGLGAVESLDGEIFIRDGDILVSQIRNDSIVTSRGDSLNAALLVYSRVTAWDSVEISGPVMDLRELEEKIARLLKARDLSGPTAFLIEGRAVQLTGHVITKESVGASNHHLSGHAIVLTDRPVELLGFYSTQHQGVFTHKSSYLHVHFLDRARNIVGHIDEIRLMGPVRVFLPGDC